MWIGKISVSGRSRKVGNSCSITEKNECNYSPTVLRVRLGSFSEARRKSLSVRFVPKAEVNLWILNVGYGESRRSDIIDQGLQCALSGPLKHVGFLCGELLA